MLNHTFTFNGHTSDEFGIKIERFRALNRPGRKYDAASVPGRNGILYKLQEAWEEILVSYEIFAEASVGDTEADFSKIDGTYFAWTADGLTVNGTVPAPYEIEEAAELIAYRNRTIVVQGGETGVWELVCRVVDDYGTTTRTATITNGSETFVLGVGDYLYIDLKLYSGTYTNEVIPLKIIDGEILDLPKKWTEIMEWLNSADGYAELTDSFDPEHYHEAVFVDSTDIQNSWNHYGRTVVSFRCRPERFLIGYKNVTLDLTTLYGLVSEGKQLSPVLTQAAAQSPSNPQIGTVTNIPFEILGEANGYYRIKTYYGLDGYVLKTDVYTMNGAKFTNPTNNIAKPKVYINTQNTSGFETWVVMINNDPSEKTASYKRRNIKYSMTYAQTDDRQRCLDCENENIYTLYYEDSLDLLFRVAVTENINPYVSVTYSDDTATPEFFALNPNDNIILCNGFVDGITMDARIWEK